MAKVAIAIGGEGGNFHLRIWSVQRKKHIQTGSQLTFFPLPHRYQLWEWCEEDINIK